MPALTYGVHFGDWVEVVASGEGPLVATRIASRSGYSTLRLFLGHDEVPVERLLGVVEELARTGALVDVDSDRLVSAGYPAEIERSVRKQVERTAKRLKTEWEAG